MSLCTSGISEVVDKWKKGCVFMWDIMLWRSSQVLSWWTPSRSPHVITLPYSFVHFWSSLRLQWDTKLLSYSRFTPVLLFPHNSSLKHWLNSFELSHKLNNVYLNWRPNLTQWENSQQCVQWWHRVKNKESASSFCGVSHLSFFYKYQFIKKL